MKRILLALLIVASLLSGLAQSPASVTTAEARTKRAVTVKVASKKVNKKTITMKKGSSKKIRLSFQQGQSGVTTKYQSDKKDIVSVSKAGTLKARKTGTAKITVTVSGDKIQKAKIWFKVKVVRMSGADKKADTSGNEIPVVITVNGQKFKAVFYNNETANALLKKMPMTLTMKELNGNEKYQYFDTEFPTNEKSPGKIKTGDLMMYGSDCLVAFYKTFTTSYRYTSVGYVEDASGFAKALGKGNIEVSFQKG